jgi:NDP-sugar pyrophosphorylase family protein
MLPVGDRPLLERIVHQLRDAGIRRINVTTHYRADAIARHFGDGSAFGVELRYVSEEQPLGTAGALGLVDSDDPILVMNGDILTSVDFRAMHRFHDEHEASLTVAVRPYEVSVPYGLVELDRDRVVGIHEKPVVKGFLNAGIYLIGPEARRLVAAGERLEMTQLIDRVVAAGQRVIGFPLREYWLDIGHPNDYEQALADAEAQL